MKVIDFHTHIFPDRIAASALQQLSEHSGEYRPCTDGTLKGLLESMDRAGIGMSVVSNIATRPAQTEPIFDFSCRIKSDRISPLISFHPENSLDEVAALLERAAGEGIRGVKLHPMYQDFAIDDERMFPFYELLRERGFFVVFHSGYDIAFPGNTQADLGRVRTMAGNFRDLRIVVTHTGGWRQWDRVGLITDLANVYTEISMTLTEMDDGDFMDILSMFDEDRVFFGTDSPWTDQTEMVRRVQALKMADSLKEKILCRNAELFLAP